MRVSSVSYSVLPYTKKLKNSNQNISHKGVQGKIVGAISGGLGTYISVSQVVSNIASFALAMGIIAFGVIAGVKIGNAIQESANDNNDDFDNKDNNNLNGMQFK